MWTRTYNGDKGYSVQQTTDGGYAELQNKMRQIMGGEAGPEAANSLTNWENNRQLQGKLTEAQKNLFREAMAKAPRETSKAADALLRLTQQQGFGKAITKSQQMGTLQAGILQNPGAEREASAMLASRFMQSPKADARAKGQFLRFGLDRAKDGRKEAWDNTADMLGTLAKSGVGKLAQRAAMSMANRKLDDPKAMKNVDIFVDQPTIQSLPSFARTKATELLAKADGKEEVKQGLEKLSGESKFRAQTAENKGRFFSTIGTSRSTEYRPLTDKLLGSLQSANFPSRSAQVGKFLNKVSAQVRKGGAEGVDTYAALKSAKRSAHRRKTQRAESKNHNI